MIMEPIQTPKKPLDVDDWIEQSVCQYEDKKRLYAAFVLDYFRRPAIYKTAFREFMKEHKLFCTYNNKRYRVTGASRMGDVWLAEDFKRENGYDLRVDVQSCSNWSAES